MALQKYKTATGQIQYINPELNKELVAGLTPVDTITGESLKPTTPIDLAPKKDTTNYDSFLAGGQGILDFFSKSFSQQDTDTSDLSSRINKLFAQPESQATAYESAYETAGMRDARTAALTKQSAVKASQAKLAGVQAQIQAVVDKRDQQNLILERDSAGRGITGTILGRQQQEINRQAAIEALPLQALALSAQAEVQAAQGEAEFAQSTLKMAQDKLDTAFQLKSKDAENTYNYWKDLRGKIFDSLTQAQKDKVTAQQKEDDRKFEIEKDNRKSAQSIVKDLMASGQGELAAKITQLDTKSPTFSEDLATLQLQARPKEDKDLQFVSGTANQPSGVFDKTTGVFIPTGGGGTPEEQSPYQVERAFRTIQSVNELAVKAKQNPGIFGRTAALPIPGFLRSSAFRDFESELDTLKSNIAFGELTAMREASKTGGALGQVSDKEAKLLESALGALSMTQSPKNFQAQLDKINASITRWQNTASKSQKTSGNLITAPDGQLVEITD